MSDPRSKPEVSSGAALGNLSVIHTQVGKRPLEQEDRTAKRQKSDDSEQGAQIAPNELETVAVERDQVRAELEAARNQVGEWKAKFDAEATRRQELDRSCEGLKVPLKARYYEIEDLKREAEAARKERDAALQARREDPKACDKLQNRLKAAHNKLSKYGLAASALAARKTDPWKYLAECDKQAAQNQTLAAERDQLTAERDQLAAERDGLAAERDKLMTERDGLATTHKELKLHDKRLTEERDNLYATCKKWETWNQKRAAERKTLEVELERFKDLVDGERSVHRYSRAELTAVSIILEATEKRVAERDEQIESLQQQLDTCTLIKQITSAWDEVLRVNQQADMYRRQVELLSPYQLGADMAKVQDALAESQQKILDQEKQLISLTDQKGKLIEEIGRLKWTWQEERKRVACNSLRELDDLRAENVLLCTQLDEAVAENGRLRASRSQSFGHNSVADGR